jgi:glucokinase
MVVAEKHKYAAFHGVPMKKRVRKAARRPSRSLRHAALHVGVDLGGTNVRAGLVDASGRISRLESAPSRAGEGKARALAAIIDAIARVMDRRVAGIGVGVPGQVKDGRIVKLPHLPDLNGVDLEAILRKRFRKPAKIENDANCFALAEAHFGHGKGARSVVGLILGTGCGSGVVLDGKVYGGRDNLAGEFGMIHYRATLIEDYVAGRFIKSRAEEMKLQDTAPEAVASDAAGKHLPTYAEKVRLASHGIARLGDAQARARKIFDDLGYHVGYLLSVIICAYNPDIIVLGGGVSKSHALFWEPMRRSLDLNIEYPAMLGTKIAVSTLEKPGVLGAAALFR